MWGFLCLPDSQWPSMGSSWLQEWTEQKVTSMRMLGMLGMPVCSISFRLTSQVTARAEFTNLSSALLGRELLVSGAICRALRNLPGIYQEFDGIGRGKWHLFLFPLKPQSEHVPKSQPQSFIGPKDPNCL